VTSINLAIAGATGWTGSAIAAAALAAPDISQGHRAGGARARRGRGDRLDRLLLA
jgi:hypothetical protein